MTPRRQVLGGIAASPGVAVGRVCLINRAHIYVPRRYIAREEVASEESRLHAAIENSRRELEEIRARLGSVAEHRLLLDAQLLMHRDELLIDGAVELLRERCVNAEWALAQVIANIAGRMRQASEEYFRERAVDIENVGERILHKLVGTVPRLPAVGPDAVIVADDLGPADAAQLLRAPARGIAIDLGSASSHTAILARALHIPAVVGVRGLSSLVADDDLVIVDAFRGEVILEPNDEEIERARERGERYRQFTQGLRRRGGPTVETRDGTRITLDANVEVPPEAALAMQAGAAGVGLYRTEFLFLDRTSLPDEAEQTQVYSDVAQVLAPKPVVFRTFDLGGDRLHGHETGPDIVNPALGLRALRFGLSRPALLKTQLRAMLRASTEGNVRIMFPLVSCVSELVRAKALLAQAREELEREGVSVGPVRTGCMVEVPSAALIADTLARECDFFSVGTNDLVQYTLAVDRSNPRVAHLGNVLHPAVLRLLQMISTAARSAGIGLEMCGGMAADPLALPLVLGLGFHHLSVDLGHLPLVRACIEAVDLARAEQVARAALASATGDDVRALVIESFGDALRELWEEQGLLANETG